MYGLRILAWGMVVVGFVIKLLFMFFGERDSWLGLRTHVSGETAFIVLMLLKPEWFQRASAGRGDNNDTKQVG